MIQYPILNMNATGKRIKKLRMDRQISVMDICEYMGFENPQAVYKWQRGETLPSVDNLFALSRLFDTTVDDILCEKEEVCASSFSFRCIKKRTLDYYIELFLNLRFNDVMG